MFTFTLKIMFQTLCCEKLMWDQELSDDLKQKWEVLIKAICYLENIHLPRCYNQGYANVKTMQLHGFSDASGKAFEGNVYLRTVYDDDDKIETSLVCAKAK